jgi:hypothetical protein
VVHSAPALRADAETTKQDAPFPVVKPIGELLKHGFDVGLVVFSLTKSALSGGGPDRALI